jgi:hypothetical protein
MVQKTRSKSGGEPRLSPQIAALVERMKAGSHQGEPFQITITEGEFEEAVAWYLDREPNLPFRRLDITVQDGLPVIYAQELEVGQAALPDFIRFQIEDKLNRRLNMREEELPVVLEEIELEEGRLTVRGRIR